MMFFWTLKDLSLPPLAYVALQKQFVHSFYGPIVTSYFINDGKNGGVRLGHADFTEYFIPQLYH